MRVLRKRQRQQDVYVLFKDRDSDTNFENGTRPEHKWQETAQKIEFGEIPANFYAVAANKIFKL